MWFLRSACGQTDSYGHTDPMITILRNPNGGAVGWLKFNGALTQSSSYNQHVIYLAQRSLS